MRLKSLSWPIKRVKQGSQGSFYDVDIVPMTDEHATWWHEQVQPIIDGNYWHWSDGEGAERHRADVGWNWKRILLLARGHNFTRRVSRSERAYAWALLLKGANGAPGIPIGLLTVVPDYNANVMGSKQGRAFVWYLADAPKELYSTLGLAAARGVATTLLDSAVLNRLDLCLSDVCTFLHAAPEGGPKLLRYYKETAKMTQIQGDWPRISLGRPYRNGEYFIWDDMAARDYCHNLNKHR